VTVRHMIFLVTGRLKILVHLILLFSQQKVKGIISVSYYIRIDWDFGNWNAKYGFFHPRYLSIEEA